jgi:acyl-CoA synthetase (AMP-forming)/AMP-acid ligase II
LSIPQSIPDALDRAATTWPDTTALEDGALHLSFSELRILAHRAARSLKMRGIKPGDKVAIWAPNTWEWVVAALGIHCAGAVLVTLNTRYKGFEARQILDSSKAKFLFTVDGFLGLDFKTMLKRPKLKTVVFRDDFELFLAEGESGSLPKVPGDALADLLFTSGTTGAPKGAMCTHEQAVRAYTSWSEVVGLTHGDRYLVIAPFFHAFGYKAGWLACLLRGATILPQVTFDLDEILERIPADKVTVLPGPPAIYQSFLMRDDLDEHDLSSLRLAVTGAASIPVQLIRDMRDVLGFDTVITGYGLTEACGIATMCRYDDDPETIATTSGRAIDGVEVICVDTDGKPVPAGEPGHVLVRGYNVMTGYFRDAAKTAETIVDGWLHTGDIGYLDEDNFLYLVDRAKDMVLRGGENVYCSEVETVLFKHDAVAECAVFSVPDERLGEEVGAAIFPKAGAEVSADDLREFCKDHLAAYKIPRYIWILDEPLPRNASGKFVKRELQTTLDLAAAR